VSDAVVTDAAAEAEPEATPPEELHGAAVTWSRGHPGQHPTRDGDHHHLRVRHDQGYLMCVDLTVVDYLTHPGRVDLPDGVTPERFEVVVGLLSHRDRDRIRLRVQVPETDATLPTLFALHPGTEAMEREAFDMFGIAFDGHPDLTRILMPEDWDGHPLRKDAPSGRIPVQFKDAPAAR
jgi:NADH-quinone oxidoreductase subunit C